MLTITYKNDAGEKVVHPLERGALVGVGRSPDSPIRIRHSSVSRSHAEFYEADDGGWCVRDVGSSNHTFLNGEKVEISYIQAGDTIRFGDFTVRVEEVASPARGDVPAGRRARPAAEPEPERRARPAAEPEPERRARPTAEPEPERRLRPVVDPVEPLISERRPRPAPASESERVPRPASRPSMEAIEPIVAGRRARPSLEEVSAVERRARPVLEDAASSERRRAAVDPVEVIHSERRVRPSLDEVETERRRPSSESVEAVVSERRVRPSQDEVEASERRRPVVEPLESVSPKRRSLPEDDASAAKSTGTRTPSVDGPEFHRPAPEVRKAMIGVDPAELRAAQDRANKFEEQLKEQRLKYDEALRRIEDLELRDAQHEDELREWRERYDKAREQTDHVQDLLERTRGELRDSNEDIAGLKQEVEELEGQVRKFEATRDEASEVISDYKTKLVHKDRRIDELQRELDMMEFDLRSSRDELESLQHSMNFENTETRKLERELSLLREVIHEKENHIKSLQNEIEDREKVIYDLKLGTGVKDLQEAKTEMMEKYFAKDKENQDLRDRIARLEQTYRQAQGELEDMRAAAAESRDLSNHPDMKRKEREMARLQSDLDDARDEVLRFKNKLEGFGPEQKAALESEIEHLRRKNGVLESRAAEGGAREDLDLELVSARRKIAGLEAKSQELEQQLREAQGRGGEHMDASTRRQVVLLEDKVEDLSLELRRVRAEADRLRHEAEHADAGRFDREGALDAVDNMMDLFRSWMSNLNVLKTYGQDLGHVEGVSKSIQDAVDGIGQTLHSIEKDADDLRTELRSLRGAIEKG